MVRKASPVLFAVLAAFLLIASNAKAEVENQDYGSGDPCFSVDYGWGDCYTEVSYNGPTAIICTARASNNQRCKECKESFDDRGVSRGYSVCGYVAYSAACSCANSGTAACSPTGACTYSL
jgi:hypothetical protein